MNKSKIKLTKLDILLGLLLIVIIFLIILLFSYAHFQVQTVENLTASTVQGDFECLDISFNEKGAINLNKNYPVTDDYALENFTPIEATVVNNCSTNKVNYVLSLSSIYLKSSNYDTSYIPDNKIRVKITKEVGASGASSLVNTNYLSNMSVLDSSSNSYKYISNFYKTDSNYTNYNLKNTYKVDSSSIGANTTIKYKIYLWIDYYEGAPNRENNDEYNNSTQGLKFSASSVITLNIKESINQNISTYLINNAGLWQSGLEGDGYRYAGTAEYICYYNNGLYATTSGINGCTNSVFDTDNNKVTLDENGVTKLATAPNNYICFGTTNEEECLNNQNKYMYRIIGVFPDENGEQHVKLIKYKQLGNYGWNSDRAKDVAWENSSLYKGLNGSYFLTNTTYDYLQNNTWLNKISNWKWTATNSTFTSNNIIYENGSPKNVYLHEMNRSTKTNSSATWTNPQAKVGLLYISDYLLSLGAQSLSLNEGSNIYGELFVTGWIHQNSNDLTYEYDELTISHISSEVDGLPIFDSIVISQNGRINQYSFDGKKAVRPVFYLTNDVILSSGNGTIASPYILTE